MQVRVPEHVVYRTFPQETVALNLETGKYHSLNPTAGRMLEALDQHGDVDEVARIMAEEYKIDLEQIGADLRDLCNQLTEQKLILID